MNFGFSYIGLIFLVMLFVPNIIWSKNKPVDYDKYIKNENRTLSILESIGQVLVVLFALFFDLNISGWSLWIVFLVLAFILMILYELYWVRYFKSPKRMSDMYCEFLHIPLAGSTLPVMAFFLLGVYERNVFLIIATIILGIGHIGIHLNHEKEFK